MRNVLLVARRELQVGVMKRSFVITTAIMVTLLVAGIFVLNYFVTRDSGERTERIAFTADSSVLVPSIEATASAQGLAVDAVTVADRGEGEAAVMDGDVIALIIGEPPTVEVAFKASPNQTIMQVVAQALQSQTIADQVLALGGDPQEFTQAVASAVPTVTVLDGDIDDFGPAYMVAVVVASLLLFGLMTSGSIISMGVVEEKSSRVVEILLATIRPSQLFAGKVLGAGLIGLVQLVSYGAGVFLAVKITGLLDGFDLPVGSALLGMLGWFILGFASIGTLWGGLSSLVSRQEDVGSVTAPMIFASMVPFYVAIYLVPNAPESAWTVNLSMAPFFAPFVMPVREVFADVPGWQLAVSIALNLAVIPLIVWVAGTIYKRSVLHTGSRMKLSEVFAKRA